MRSKRLILLMVSCLCSMKFFTVSGEESNRNEDYNLIAMRNSYNLNGIRDMGGVPYRYLHISRNYTKGSYMEPKYIVIHDTDNKGYEADAYAHYTYFNNNYVGASAHYFIDEDEVIQTVDDNLVAWHAGDRYPGVTPNVPDASNLNSIGVEMCVNSNGSFEKTYDNTIKVVKELMNKHNIPVEKVIMHNDVSGKYCSKKMKDNPSLWINFKKALGQNYDLESNYDTNNDYDTNNSHDSNSNYGEDTDQYEDGIVTENNLKLRSGSSTNEEILKVLPKGMNIKIIGKEDGWYKTKVDGIAGYVYGEYIEISNSSNNGSNNEAEYNVGIANTDELKLRREPSTDNEIIRILQKGTRMEILGEENGWCKVKIDGIIGYVYGVYVNLEGLDNGDSNVEYSEGVSTENNLKLREGPSTDYEILKVLELGTNIHIIGRDGVWLKVTIDGTIGYVHSDYVDIQ